MNKSDLKKDDILILKNNHTVVMDVTKFRIIHERYDDELNCLENDDYSVEKIYRPEYKLVFEREKGKEHGIKR